MSGRTPWSKEWKREVLESLYVQWSDCRACTLSDERTNVVFGNGNPDADIMMIAEAPGDKEDKSGEVFVGASGLLLNDLLKAAGLVREELFITNMVMCHPPENRDPTKEEKTACLSRLHRQIYVVDPLVVVLIGKVSMVSMLKGEWKSIVDKHGSLGELKVPGVHSELRYPAMPILHPAYILREDKINKKTGNWEPGGLAHQTMLDLIVVKEAVDFLKQRYKPVRARLEGRSQVLPARTARLKVIK